MENQEAQFQMLKKSEAKGVLKIWGEESFDLNNYSSNDKRHEAIMKYYDYCESIGLFAIPLTSNKDVILIRVVAVKYSNQKDFPRQYPR